MNRRDLLKGILGTSALIPFVKSKEKSCNLSKITTKPKEPFLGTPPTHKPSLENIYNGLGIPYTKHKDLYIEHWNGVIEDYVKDWNINYIHPEERIIIDYNTRQKAYIRDLGYIQYDISISSENGNEISYEFYFIATKCDVYTNTLPDIIEHFNVYYKNNELYIVDKHVDKSFTQVLYFPDAKLTAYNWGYNIL